MIPIARRSLEDLPKFTVRSVREQDNQLVLSGVFDRLDGVRAEGWDYLYSFGPPYLAADVASLDLKSKCAEYRVFREHGLRKDVLPQTVLYWLSAYWKPDLVDAVLDAQYVWTAQQVAVDHEHCDICNCRISAGSEFYSYSTNVFICADCFEKFAKPHDLSFLF